MSVAASAVAHTGGHAVQHSLGMSSGMLAYTSFSAQ